jgi:hypothetical protein
MIIIATPSVAQLGLVPQLAILSTLEATLTCTIAVMHAAHPETDAISGWADDAVVHEDVAAAAELACLAQELIAAITTYRCAIDPYLVIF